VRTKPKLGAAPTAGARAVGTGAADNDNSPAFTVTRAELAGLIRQAVSEALGRAPLLLDKQAMAHQLGCSPEHVDHLRKRGLPWVAVGQAVRFEAARVLEWLRDHASKEKEPNHE
jgi:hypothetical protein